jgi:hypothetical protein
MVGEELNIIRETAGFILMGNLGIKIVCRKSMPNNLLNDHLQLRRKDCTEFLQRMDEDEERLNTVIAKDKSSVLQRETEKSMQSLR